MLHHCVGNSVPCGIQCQDGNDCDHYKRYQYDRQDLDYHVSSLFLLQALSFINTCPIFPFDLFFAYLFCHK